jgi:chloride channel protein, CIC family
MSRPRQKAYAEREKLLLLALAVGALGGAAALLLRYAATALPRIVWPASDNLVRAVAAAPAGWKLAVPVVGALLAGLVLSLGERWTGAARGWDILEAVALRSGELPLRPSLVRAASSLLTVASAGAVGREGPIVLISAAVASRAGSLLRVSPRQLRILVGCGIAAGMACAYNTPVGAALFTMEVIFGSFALDVFAPLVAASVVATLLTRATFGDAPVFRVPSLAMSSPLEIVLFAALGVLGGLLAAAFLLALRASAALYRRSRLPRSLAMATAGLALGLVILCDAEIVGNGREAIAELFLRDWTFGHVLALLALRLLVTPLAVGSGTVGGVFTPTLFLGAMLGHAAGSLVRSLAPWSGAEPGAYALVGMACLLAGTTHAPMTSALIVFEMTLDYNLVLPLLLGSALSALVATRLAEDSVYTEALRRKAETQEGGGPRGGLAAMRVRDLMRQDQVTASGDTPLPKLLERFVAERRNHVYLVGAEERFEGAVNLHDVSRELRENDRPGSVSAQDVARRDFESTTPDEALARVLDRFASQECERLPVLADRDTRRLVGTISKRDILAAYSRDLLERASHTGGGGA